MTRSACGLRAKIRPLFWSPRAMVVTALALRLLVMGFAYKIQLDPEQDHWTFGWETGRVARSIVTGGGFSSPFPEPSGPTAHLPPAYAYLLAGVFKLFGIYTTASALAILTLNNLFSSLTCLPIFWIARRVFGLRVAAWAGWTWAFFPYAVFLSNRWIWETILTMLLLTLLMWLTLHLERSPSLIAWVGYGLLWGFTALSNPVTLSTLPFLGAWIWLRHWRRGKNCTGDVIIASIMFFIVITPWIWHASRNYGRFVAFRSDFGLEFLFGNTGVGSSPVRLNILPDENPAEMEKVQRMGESLYLAGKQLEAREWFGQHRIRFAELTLRRILYNWTGLWDFGPIWTLDGTGLPHILTYSLVSFLAFAGLAGAIRDDRDGAVPLAILLICFPLVYYITHLEERYRHPIDPVIVIFAVFGAITFRRQWMRMTWERQNV
jgi:4-amino-4-deoxy-L-arabinose transferase-like glycosyltransferase